MRPQTRPTRVAEAAFSWRDFDAAIKNYTKALEYDPRNYGAVLFLGDTYFAEKDWTKAGEWYQKAIDLDPEQRDGPPILRRHAAEKRRD